MTPNPAWHPQCNTPLVLGSGEAMVSALWPSLGTGDMQGVTLAKQCHQHPGGGNLSEGLCPTTAPCQGCTCSMV